MSALWSQLKYNGTHSLPTSVACGESSIASASPRSVRFCNSSTHKAEHCLFASGELL